ncbi:MAG: GNAT family N-acetyltransferase [Acidobacteria bacterium]|nr:GNAT family N-acetyltransferase [Acidobacteriota bacterium]MBI3422782.1 GNAT family N-acetyltransferase [Acidobacteriota bacterium]
MAEPILHTHFKLASAAALQVQVHHDDAALDALCEDWEELIEHCAQSSFFLTWSWVRLWWQTYAPPQSKLYLLTCRDSENRLIGLAPFYWQQRRFCGVPHLRDLNFLGTGAGLKTSEHLDLLARRGCERLFAETCAAFLLQRRDWDRLWLWNIPEQSKTLSHLQPAFGQAARVGVCDHPHHLDVSADWETTQQNWTRKFGSNNDRCARNLQKQFATEFRRVETESELETGLDDFVRLHQMRWQAKGASGSFAYPRFESFLRAAMRQALRENRLAFWTYKFDGKCVATLVAFLHNGVAHYFQGGFDMEYARHSLGSVMLTHCIRDCVTDPHLREFDFMGGGAAYKDSWTKTTRAAFELEVFRPTLGTLLYTTGMKTRKLLSRARRAVRARLQQSKPTS